MQQTRLQESTAAAAALDELHRICPSRWRRAILRAALRAGRFLAKAREDTRFCRTQLYGFSREVMGRLGSDLAAAGCLDSPEDYVHLEAEELLGAFDGTCYTPRPSRPGTSAKRRLPTVMRSARACGQFHDRGAADRCRRSSAQCCNTGGRRFQHRPDRSSIQRRDRPWPREIGAATGCPAELTALGGFSSPAKPILDGYH